MPKIVIIFKKNNARTDFGSYYGIYKDKKLVAITVERMKMDPYTESIVIITNLDFIAKEYAKQLIKFAIVKIFNEQKNSVVTHCHQFWNHKIV